MATEITTSDATAEEAISDRAQQLVTKTLMLDALSGRIIAPEPPPVDGVSYLDRVISSGLNVVNMTLAARSDDFEVILEQMYQYFNLMSAKPDKVLHVKTVADIARAYREGRLGIIFGSQSGTPVGKVIGRWTILHQLGLRICQITYNERNDYGDGCMEPENRGLTAYGRMAVQEMNRLGICVDLSHVGERTALDAIEYSAKPVIFTHSNPKAVSPSRRNATDEQMKKMAATGGVMGMTPHSMLTYRTLGIRPTIEDFLDMVDYAVQLIGIDHVGIGTDLMEQFTKLTWESTTKRMYPNPYFYETMWADGFNSVSHWPRAVDGLVRRGYSDEDIAKIVGGNWIRVFGEVWEEGDTPAPVALSAHEDRLWGSAADGQSAKG
jgi:membrane dipeptidase